MADQNQTVHTVFTGEAHLETARAELKLLNDQFLASMKSMEAAVSGVDKRTLAMLRNYNKAMGTLQQAQTSLSRTGMGFAAGAARSNDAAEVQSARRRGDQMARLVDLERQLQQLREKERTTKRDRTRIDTLERERAALVQLYEAEERVAEQRRRAEARTLSRSFGSYERQTVTEARAYLRTQERILEIQNRLGMAQAGKARLSRGERAALQNELNLSERLLRLHEQDAAVMARVLALRQKVADKEARQQQHQDPSRRMGVRADLMGDYAALGGVAVAGYSVINFAVEEESAMAKFQAIAAASDNEVARLSQHMKELGQNSRFTNIEIAETATVLAQAGLSARDTGPALEAISQLATAAGIELRQAADVVTSVANIWMYNAGQMSEIADVLTAALNQTKLGMDQMQLGIQYAGNTAVDAGVGFVELTSIMGAMAQAGIRSGSTIGTGLRTLLTDLQNPTEKAMVTLDRLGLSLADVDVNTMGLTQVLHNLRDAGFTTADAMGAFEIRSASAFAAISNNLDVVDELQGSLYDTDAAARANAIQMDTWVAKWTSFKNTILLVSAEALRPMIDLSKALLGALTALLGGVDPLMPALQAATAAATVFIASFAVNRIALAAKALMSIALGTTAVGAASAGAAGGVAALNASLLATPVGWIALIVGAGAALYGLLSTSSDTKDELDLLNGAINDLNSSMEETQTTIKAVEETTAQLRSRMTALAQNEVMRGRIVEQARQRFETLGLEIDDNTNSVEGMIEALERLRMELNKEFESELLALADRLDERISKMNEQLSEGEVLTREQKREARNADETMWRNGVEDTPERLRLRQLLRGSRTLGEDYTTDQYRGDMQGLRAQREAMEAARDRAPLGSRERARLDDGLEALRTFISLMGAFQTHLNQINQEERRKLDAEKEAIYQGELARPGSQANSMRNQGQRWLAEFETKRAEIENSAADASSKAEQLETLRDQALTRLHTFLETGRPLVEADPVLSANGLSEHFLTDLQTQLTTQINTLFARTTDYAAQGERDRRANEKDGRTAVNDAQDLTRRLSTAEREALEARMGQLEAEIERLGETQGAAGVEEIQRLATEWRRLNAELAVSAQEEARARLETSGQHDRRGGLQMPVSGPVSSAYSLNRRNPVTGRTQPHQGMDIAVRQGTGIGAAGTGTVVYAGAKGGYGNTVEIEHANGIRTLYAHLSEILVKVGDTVDKGERIALSGGRPNTPGAGRSTGEHLHFGVQQNGQWVNPATMMGTGPAGAASGDPTYDRLAALSAERAEAESQERLDKFNGKVTEIIGEAVFEPLELEWKARRELNERMLSTMIEGLESSGSEMTTLAGITQMVNERTLDNMKIARDLMEQNPDNAGKLNNPAFIQAVNQEVASEMMKGAETMEAAYAAYIALQARLGEDRVNVATNEARIADARAGTSDTTRWLLEKRIALEEYNAALAVAAAAEETLAAAEAERAAQQVAVVEATTAMQEAMTALNTAVASGNAEEIVVARAAATRAEQALALAQATLERVQQIAAAAGVRADQLGAAAASVAPINPIPAGAAGATAAGPQGIGAQLQAAIDRYKEQSGVMVDISQTIADGIYGTFSALGQGIEDTINQIADGSITIGGAFKNIFGGILKEMQAMAAKIAANWIMQQILKMAMSAIGGPAVGIGGTNNAGIGTGGSGWTSSLRMKHGGEVKRRALGGGGQYGRDSVNLLAEPGEVVMRKSAVDFIGRDALLGLNAMGNRKLAGAQARMPAMPQREPDTVNVWAVAPNQVPPPSKKDIIHMIGESMLHGDLKKLVKTVAVGG